MTRTTVIISVLLLLVAGSAGCLARDGAEPVGPSDASEPGRPASAADGGRPGPAIPGGQPGPSGPPGTGSSAGTCAPDPQVVLDWQRPDGAHAISGSVAFDLPPGVESVTVQQVHEAYAGSWELTIRGPGQNAVYEASGTHVKWGTGGITTYGGEDPWTTGFDAGAYELEWRFHGASLGFGLMVTAAVC